VQGLGEQVDDARLVLLAIAVDAAVALLEGHQGPGHVEVDHPVAEVVQIQTFSSHVGSQQEADGVLGFAEGLNDLLLLGVRLGAMQHAPLAWLEAEVSGEVIG